MQLTLVTNYDDWEGLYVGETLADEGHRLSIKEVLAAVGLSVDIREANNEWLAEMGCLPNNLGDVKFSE